MKLRCLKCGNILIRVKANLYKQCEYCNPNLDKPEHGVRCLCIDCRYLKKEGKLG